MIELNTPLAKGIVIKNNILFFTKSCLSQWYGAYKGQAHKLDIPPLFFYNSNLIWWQDITLIHKPISFNCCEQAMMFCKALLFKDKEIALKILEETNPRYQKDLGRQVKNYDDSTWNERRFAAIKTINKFKFRDNPDLKEFLLSTGNLILAELNPKEGDMVWSCGLTLDDADITDVTTWQGQNLLGRVLMAVREELRDD